MAMFLIRVERRAIGFTDLDIELAQRPVVEAFMTKMVERAVLNAPILKNRLRPSISFRPINTNYRGAWQMNLAANTGGEAPWAIYMHEGSYNLGPESRKQPMTEEGGVGPGYLRRVIYYHLNKKELQQEFIKKLEEIGVKKGYTKR